MLLLRVWIVYRVADHIVGVLLPENEEKYFDIICKLQRPLFMHRKNLPLAVPFATAASTSSFFPPFLSEKNKSGENQ